jgi:two-component system response regulator RegA
MTMQRLLLVDDDVEYAEILAEALTRRGCRVTCAHTVAEALTLAAQQPFDDAVLDLRLANEATPGNGLSLIAPLRERHPEIRILLLTGYASIATAIEAIKLGATHYLAKPSSGDEILAALGRLSGEPDILIDEAPMSVDRVEWEHIQRILAEQGGNVSAAARALKMHRRTLQRKLGKRPSPG